MNPGLYAIVDADTLERAGRDVTDFTRRVLGAGSLAALQLRAKSWGARRMLTCARELGALCRAQGVPFFVNDRPDVAWLAQADGVHVGMDDLPVSDVRLVAPGLKVGASSHNPDEVSAVLHTDADYLAFGPVFGTRSKTDPAPTVGLEALARVVARCRETSRPVVAIGGITLETVHLVREAGATAVAIIGALVVDDERVTDVARALHVAAGGS